MKKVLVTTIAVLLIVSGTTAVAASHWIITMTSQIKPAVLKELHGAAGPRGVAELPGPKGDMDSTGPAGPQGPAGATGPAGGVPSSFAPHTTSVGTFKRGSDGTRSTSTSA